MTKADEKSLLKVGPNFAKSLPPDYLEAFCQSIHLDNPDNFEYAEEKDCIGIAKYWPCSFRSSEDEKEAHGAFDHVSEKSEVSWDSRCSL